MGDFLAAKVNMLARWRGLSLSDKYVDLSPFRLPHKRRGDTDKDWEMESSVLLMFFHFIRILFVAGWSPNEVVSAPHATGLQKRFGGGRNGPAPYGDINNSTSSDHASVVRRAVIGSVVGGVGLMSILLVGFLFLRRHRRRRLADQASEEEEKDIAVVPRNSELEEGTWTEEHLVDVGKNMVRLDLPAGPSGQNIRHDDPPPAYQG